MREIKFRAWCNDQKRMFTKVLAGNTTNPDSDDYTAHCIYRDGDWYHSDEHDNVVFEQYTGLKDANGKEIYEGDILCADNEKYKGLVIYYSGTAEYRTDVYLKGKNVCIYGLCEFIEKRGRATKSDCIVVGNIHQNPELLK